MNIEKIDSTFFVTGQIDVEDIENLKLDGVDSIVCNRPDGEEHNQPLAEDIKLMCKTHNIAFIYLPMTSPVYNEEYKQPLLNFLKGKEKTLGYCKTGRRALVLYKAAMGL